MTRNTNRTQDQEGRESGTLLRITEDLAARIGEARFEMWFGNAGCLRIENRSVLFTGDSDFLVQRVQSSFGNELRQAATAVLGPDSDVKFLTETIQPATASDEPSDSAPVENSVHDSAQPVSHTSIAHNDPVCNAAPDSRSSNPQPANRSGRRTVSLSSFHIGEENRIAGASINQVMRFPGKYSPLFVYGPPGCGKSHFLEGLTADYRRLHRCRSVFLSSEEFTSMFIGSLRGAGLPMFRRKYRDIDFLAVDDVQFFEGKRATTVEFQSTVDNLLRMGKQVVVSSDRPPAELRGVSTDLAARLTAGLICPLSFPMEAERRKIAASFCRDRGYDFHPDVLDLVSSRISGDVRRISGALNHLHVASIVQGKPVDVDLAADVLRDLFAIYGATTSLVRIEKAVCEICRVDASDLRSSSRRKKFCTPRMLAMYLAREHTTNAFSEIGDYFGGRSHSTVIAAQKKVAGWLQDQQRIELPHAAYATGELLERIKSNLRIG